MDFCYHSATWTSVFLQFSLSLSLISDVALHSWSLGKEEQQQEEEEVEGKREAGRED